MDVPKHPLAARRGVRRRRRDRPIMPHQHFPHTPNTTDRFHLDLNALDLATENLLIRRRVMAVARPTQRDIERLAGLAARLEREAGR